MPRQVIDRRNSARTPTGFQPIAKGWTDGSCRPTLETDLPNHPTLKGLHNSHSATPLCNPTGWLLYYFIVDFAHDPRFAELLAEPLSDEEVRDLLERLGSKEFGGPENATVGAVVEATGSSVETVGNLLALIRKEDFEEKFGLKLEEHEERIDTLENHARQAVRTVHGQETHVRRDPHLDPYQQRALERLAEEERQREALGPIAAVVACVMVLVFLVVMGGQCDSQRREVPYSSTSYEVTDGTVHLNSRGESWVQLKSGGRRAATDEELSVLYGFQAARDSRK